MFMLVYQRGMPHFAHSLFQSVLMFCQVFFYSQWLFHAASPITKRSWHLQNESSQGTLMAPKILWKYTGHL